MRRMANLLRDPPMLGGDGGSINTSICSSPHSTMEPGDRGAAPVGASAGRLSGGISRVAVQGQLSALADKMNATISNLQWQCQEDRRRIAALERKIESRLEERVTTGDAREKWADIQGSVNGLIEETQSLTRRVEGLDERLWARTSGTEAAKQRSRELEQQVQALEHQTRLTGAAAEEATKRHAAKLRRTEHTVEEAVRRLTKLEEQSRHASQQRDPFLESRLNAVEQQWAQLGADVRDLQAQLDEGLVASAAGGALGPPACGEVSDELACGIEESIRAAERTVSTLDRRLTSQVEEVASSLASMRVKVDGQLQRVTTLSDRLETAHAPALESLRSELSNRISQDRRELESELGLLRDRMQDSGDSAEELREALRQAQAEVAALGLRHAPQAPSTDEMQAIRVLDERCTIQEREMHDMRIRFEELLAAQEELEGGHQLQVEARDLDEGIEDGELRLRPGGGDAGPLGEELEEAIRASERGLAQLDKRLTSQVEEITSAQASLRVKVDRQLQRVSALAERIETAHEPAVESLRADVTQMRSQDRRELETQVASLKVQIQDLSEAQDREEREDASDGLRDLLRQVRHEIESLSKSEESPILRVIDERCGVQDEELRDLRERVEELVASGAVATAAQEPVAGAHAQPIEQAPHAAAPVAAGGAGAAVAEVEEALAQSREDFAALEERLTAKVEDATVALASLRVKVDGQGQRLGALAERAEAAHAPALESLRSELAQTRQQDQRDLSAELAKLRSERASGAEDEASECGRGGDAPAEAVQALQERCDAQERSVEAMRKRLDAMPEKADRSEQDNTAEVDELRDQVESALAQLADLSFDVKSRDKSAADTVDKALGEIRGTMADLAKRVDDVGAVSSDKGELAAIRDDVSDLKAKVGSLEARPAEPQGASGEAAAAAAQLDAVRAETKQLKAKVEEALERTAPDDELQGQVDELRRDVEALSAKDDSKEAATRLDGLQAELQGLRGSVAEASDAAKKAAEQVVEVKSSATGVQKRLEDLQSQLEKVRDASWSLDKGAPPAAAAADPELLDRVSALEDRVAAIGSGSAPASTATAIDEQARSKVHDQVEDLTRQLADEVASLARHQQTILDTRESLDSLATKVSASGAGPKAAAAPGGGADAAAVRSLTDRVDAACERLQSLEDASGVARREIEQLRGPRKVGISVSPHSFSLEDARAKLELLSEQVLDLQARGVASGGAGGGGDVGAGARGGKAQVPEPEASLNFSLTEQPDRPGGRGGADDSLGLSMTGSKQDFSLTDSVPILSAPPQRRSGPGGAAAPGSLSAAPGSAGGGAGARGGVVVEDDDDSDGSFDIEDAEVGTSDSPKGGGLLGGGASASKRGLGDDGGDILDSLAKGLAVGPKKDARAGADGGGRSSGSGDALDSLVGLSGGSGSGEGRGARGKQPSSGGDEARGSGHLARVEEETSDLGDASHESRASRSGSKDSKQSPAGSASKSRSSAVGGLPMPESPSGASFSGGLEAGLEISMSCNEVSYGGDYSVEDSQELDKCDHVEEVKPMGPLQKQVAATAVANAAAARGEGASLAPAPKAAASSSSGTGIASSGKPQPQASPKDLSQSKGDDEYGDDFDDEDQNSVSEEIEAEEDESGSDSGA